MNIPCPKEPCGGTVDYAPRHELYAVCDTCDSYFEVEPDADFNGECFVDTSTLGREMLRVVKSPESRMSDYDVIGGGGYDGIYIERSPDCAHILCPGMTRAREFDNAKTDQQILNELGYFIV